MAAWVLPAALLAVSVASTALAFQQQKQAASEQKKANQIQRQGQDAQVRRARIQEVARARRERAAAVAAAEGAGALGVGSSVAGGIGSVTSQSAGNQAFLTGQQDFARAAGRAQDRASAANTRAGAFDAVGSIANSGLNIYANRVALGF